MRRGSRRGWLRPTLAALSLAGGVAALCARPALGGSATPIDGARGLYLLRCGGCHGIQGVSVPTSIPTLRGRAGFFLCTAAGRDYVLRLPNIQMALIRDDQELADVMNFVAFDLGGASAPPRARRFTAYEIASSRGRPLTPDALSAQRDALVRDAGSCAGDYRAKGASFAGPY